MCAQVSEPTEITLVMLGGKIPAIGPRVNTRRDAVRMASRYMETIDQMVSRSSSYQIILLRQSDGRYTLLLQGKGLTVELFKNMDELLFWRFRKAFSRGVVYPNCIFSGGRGVRMPGSNRGFGGGILHTRVTIAFLNVPVGTEAVLFLNQSMFLDL